MLSVGEGDDGIKNSFLVSGVIDSIGEERSQR